jgi:voltage-gated potassium channel
VTDIVSGGIGSELYRVELPEKFHGLTIDEVSNRLRDEHRATLLAVGRGKQTVVNPRSDFRLEADDDLLVVAESLGTLAPLRPDRAMHLAAEKHAHEHVHGHEKEPA